MTAPRRRWIWIPGALLVLAVFGVMVARYHFVCDDAFISFRYADNLAEGQGLVFNPGERVEGYTNFLWVLLATLVVLLGGAPEVIITALGIGCGAAVLGVTSYGLTGGPRLQDLRAWAAPLALASNRSFAMWSSGGLETQAFTLLILLAFVRFFAERSDPGRRPWVSSALFGCAVLTRPDAALFWGVAWLGFVADAWAGRRRWRDLLGWTGLFVVVVGAHVLGRLVYYGYPLPNTYYAKVTGLNLERGLLWLGMFLRDHHAWWWSPLVVAAALLRRDLPTLLLTGSLLLHTLYVTAVGGGHLEYRLLVPVLPILAWLAQEGGMELARRIPRPSLAASAQGLVSVGLVAALFAPHLTGFDGRRHGMADWESLRWYTEYRSEDGRFLRRLVEEGALDETTLVAVGGAGALPYYSRMRILDFRGLNDVQIAHEPPRLGWMAGHERWASLEYLRERGVAIYDVVNRIVMPEGDPPPASPVTIHRAFYHGPVCAVSIHDRILLFATLLDEASFREVFSAFEILHYVPAADRLGDPDPTGR